MSVERYSNTAPDAGLLVQMLLSVVYLAPLTGGTLFALRRCRADVVVACLTMLPSVASFISQSTRSAVVYSATIWIAGALTARTYSGVRIEQIDLRSIVRKLVPVIAGLIAVITLIRVGDALRGGLLATKSDPQSSFLSDRVKNPLCGHFGALSVWIDNTELDQISASWGKYTFAGLHDTILPGSRAIGIFSDSVRLPTGETNVYTYFRPLIEDASLPGSIGVIFIFGFVGGFLYRKVSERRSGWIGLLAPCYAWILFGITSIFNYNSMLLAFALYALLWWSPWRARKGLAWAQQAF
jgi:oligosaccharide repeat unit polymerase